MPVDVFEKHRATFHASSAAPVEQLNATGGGGDMESGAGSGGSSGASRVAAFYGAGDVGSYQALNIGPREMSPAQLDYCKAQEREIAVRLGLGEVGLFCS
jgi:hypothetical protein